MTKRHGIITGRNGKFYPYEKINREQMAVIIYRALKRTFTFNSIGKTFKDVPASYCVAEEINKAAANEIIKGYGDGDCFKSRSLATRAQGIVMIHRALQQEKNWPYLGSCLIKRTIPHNARNCLF